MGFIMMSFFILGQNDLSNDGMDKDTVVVENESLRLMA